MRLLVSNDDGVYARGIQTLANTLTEAGHDVTVVCPDKERSATGHGLTLHDPLRVQEMQHLFHPKITAAWACSGTPSDCVKLAIWALLDTPPDLVLSGINHGSNLGTDVLYSGTVSAAMEGVIEGIPGIAFSLTSYQPTDFQPAADFACKLVQQLEKDPLPELTLLNVNVPAVERDEIKGAMITRQGVRRYTDVFEKRVDPRGKIYYWLSGELLEDVEDPDIPNDVPTDVQAIRESYITITPLHYNLTSPLGLKMMKDWGALRLD
ncbi:MAG: 5'/3'-nucleotidase SurE [Leptolyngbya sp. Prado105]|jgi:5'-nucleotidase|nr:5'/3'-nucleotidase SurE [Leptolyngbya sp. Prado105]